MACSPRAKALTVLIVGCLLFIIGLVTGLVIRHQIDTGLREAGTVCGTDDDSFDDWASNRKKDDPAKYKYYYGFNASNVELYLQQGAANPTDLVVNMLGPYAMRQYDKFYDVHFFDDNAQVSYKTWTEYVYTQSESCDGCTKMDEFVNLNPALLTLLVQTGTETNLGLTLSNLDLTYGTVAQCDETSIPYSLTHTCDPTEDAKCCCDRTGGPTDQYSCFTRASNLYTTFAKIDGGVGFTSNVSNTRVHTPLFIRKNVHEAAYGYPAALPGVLAGLSLAQANTTASRAQLSMLADYTFGATLVCGNQSQGYAPDRSHLPELLAPLQLITCSPIAGSAYWATPVHNPQLNVTMKMCKFMEPALPGACTCVNPAHGHNGETHPHHPCCTEAGLGCLMKVTGYVSDEQYLTQEQSEQHYVADLTVQNTGCGDYKDGQEFWWSKYEQHEAKPVWSQGSRDLYVTPTAQDLLAVQAGTQNVTFYSPAMGCDATRMKAAGLNTKMFEHQLSDGNTVYDEEFVYITQIYRAGLAKARGSEMYEGIKVQRFSPIREAFLGQHTPVQPGGEDNGLVGAGTPASGVQDGTFIYGFPTYISRPLFLYGDEKLRKGNGITVLVDGDEVTPTPEAFDTYYLVEPASGMTIRGHKRLQASFGIFECLDPHYGCKEGGSMADLLSPYVPGGKVVPQYYMDETSKATDKQLDDIHMVRHAKLASDVVVLLLPLIGSIMAIAGGVMVFRVTRRKGGLLQASLMSDRN